ncbi:Zinc finger and SCAN domain-containing protein 22-like [Homarus americanus]|uniref:Zinc finger and SCAN domain-containing protein 22-like n=1 Tax=Homarus americanus TaxID=6706 RepID=A0A8J5JCX9_HOMAM|nr:Zinc finger and SCAN domain-containing protein 22-like [Homarus americanus]
MSVFIAGEGADNPPQTRCRKKYETKYSTKYESEYEWVGPSSKGETYALCRWCMVDICIKSVGAKGLRDHEITGRHKQKASDRPPPPPPQLNNAVYPVLEVEGGVEQQGAELPGSPRPATPQTPNTPLSPHGEDLTHPQPSLLDFGTQLPPTTSQTTASSSSGTPPARTATVQPKVGESLVIEYDDPNVCDSSVSSAPKATNGGTASIKRETEEKFTVSTDDLTCNVCGQEYTQWTQLKKHLVNHILMAQNSADSRTKVNPRGRGRLPSSRNFSRPSRTVQPVVRNQQKQEPDTDETTRVKRRGRPPGSRNKTRADTSSPQVNQPSPRRTVRQHTVHRVSTVQEAAVDDPLYQEPEACEVTVTGSDVAVKDHEVEEDGEEEEEEVSEEEGNEGPGCEEETDGCGKRKPGPLQCRVCRFVFFNRGELREHQRSEHNNGRPYQCSHCQKFFTTKNHMEVHVRHKHTSGPNPCQCAICGKVLSSRTNLRIHMRIHKGERPFECPVCHKAFSRKANMEMHLVYHTGERRFTCEICGQSFFAINALKRHTKLHTGERDYACEICGATYVTGTDLRRHRLKHDEVHLRYHNKELRYTCDVCNKQFVESGNYKRHMRRHTGERPYTCGICLLTFSQVHHMKTHMRTNHSEETGGGEDTGQGASGGRGRLPPHRNPRIPCRRTSKPPQMQQSSVHPTHSHPHPHLAPHPHGVGTSGSGVAVHSGQPISPPMAHSGTVPGTVAPTHTTQIPASGGVNHPAAMSGFLHGYNSHIYNHSVMPHYPLFDMCPPQNCVNHLPTH